MLKRFKRFWVKYYLEILWTIVLINIPCVIIYCVNIAYPITPWISVPAKIYMLSCFVFLFFLFLYKDLEADFENENHVGCKYSYYKNNHSCNKNNIFLRPEYYWLEDNIYYENKDDD